MASFLIVHDSVFMRMVIINILQEAGHLVIAEASNGLEAVRKHINSSPDIVIMMFGSNDAKTVFDKPGLTNATVPNWDNKADFIPDYIDLINTYRAIPSNPKIFICTTCSIKDYNQEHKVLPEVINFELQKLIHQVAKQADLPLIDVHSAMTGHEDLLEDGIHPNNEGAKIISNTVYNAIYDTVIDLQRSKGKKKPGDGHEKAGDSNLKSINYTDCQTRDLNY